MTKWYSLIWYSPIKGELINGHKLLLHSDAGYAVPRLEIDTSWFNKYWNKIPVLKVYSKLWMYFFRVFYSFTITRAVQRPGNGSQPYHLSSCWSLFFLFHWCDKNFHWDNWEWTLKYYHQTLNFPIAQSSHKMDISLLTTAQNTSFWSQSLPFNGHHIGLAEIGQV